MSKPPAPPAGKPKARRAGGGAVAQHGATALGARAVQVGGANSGDIVTGTQIVNQYLAAGPAELSREAIAAELTQYLRWLRERTQHITLRGIKRSGGAKVLQLPLETAYVPLRARPQALAGDADRANAAPEGSADGKGRSGRPKPPPDGAPDDDREADRDIPLDQLLALGHRLVVVGGPGSGKTTVLLHLAWALATSLLGGTAESL